MGNYRVTLFDRNCIKAPFEYVAAGASSKAEAIAAATQHLHELAEKDISLITNGRVISHTTTITTSKGETKTVELLEVAPRFYHKLVGECWGISDVIDLDKVGKSVSSEATVRKAISAQKHGDQTAKTERRRRWTAAEKRAAKEARKAKSNLELVA